MFLHKSDFKSCRVKVLFLDGDTKEARSSLFYRSVTISPSLCKTVTLLIFIVSSFLQ